MAKKKFKITTWHILTLILAILLVGTWGLLIDYRSTRSVNSINKKPVQLENKTKKDTGYAEKKEYITYDNSQLGFSIKVPPNATIYDYQGEDWGSCSLGLFSECWTADAYIRIVSRYNTNPDYEIAILENVHNVTAQKLVASFAAGGSKKVEKITFSDELDGYQKLYPGRSFGFFVAQFKDDNDKFFVISADLSSEEIQDIIKSFQYEEIESSN